MNQVATIEQPKEAKPLAVISSQLESMADQFRQALPAHIPLERFKRVIMTAVQTNPSLMAADRFTFWTAATKAAHDGLLPDGREGALVVFKTKTKVIEKGREVEKYIQAVNWLPMVAGIRKKVRNSGEIATWDVHVVHQHDQFEYELGDDPFIKHKPSMDADPGPAIAAYSVAVLKSGEKSREVMSRAQIEKVRAASKSPNGPGWSDWYEEMCRKVVAKRHSKVLPMSTDLDDLMRRDDELYDFKGTSDKEAAPPRPQLRQFIHPVPEGATQVQPEPEEQQPAAEPPPENPMPDFSAADAHQMGREHRNLGRALKAPPAEWRDGANPSFIEAWEDGWRQRDDELTAEAKAAKK